MPTATLAEESTTLPEGAILSLMRRQEQTARKEHKPYTVLVASRAEKQVATRVQDVSAVRRSPLPVAVFITQPA